MAYLATDSNGMEFIFEFAPEKVKDTGIYGRGVDYICEGSIIELPTGSIEQLIGKALTYEDEPVHI